MSEASSVMIETGRPENLASLNRPGPWNKFKRYVPPSITFLVIVGLWQLYAVLGLGKIPMPGPSEMLSAIVDFGLSGEFWTGAIESARVFLVGFVLGVVLGVFVGAVIGGVRFLSRSLGPLVFIGFTTPFIALIPLFLVLFGFGVGGKTAIVFFLVFITVILQTIEGIRNIDPTYLEVARAFRTPAVRKWMSVTIPAAMPYIMVGIRLGIGRGLVGTIVAEFSTAVTGLGGLILLKAQRYELADALVAPLFLAVVGISLTALVRRVENRMAEWKT